MAVSQERALEVFTAGFGTWWPREYSIGEADMADFLLEPWAGGRWYEVAIDGKECTTGRVTAFEPPDRLVLAWQLNERWRYDPDEDRASEVEVRFVAEDPRHTRVDLEHRGFERHGGGADGVRGAVDAPQGWSFCLQQFAERVGK